MTERFYAPDEKRYVEEVEKLFASSKSGFLNSFFLFARYRNSYDRYKSVRRYFPEFVKLGLANESNKTTNAKGRCLYRRIIHEEMEALHKEVDIQLKE